jgi:hypothetical protein
MAIPEPHAAVRLREPERAEVGSLPEVRQVSRMAVTGLNERVQTLALQQ